MRRLTTGAGRGTLIALSCAFAVLPIYWAVSTSLKPAREIAASPPTLLPHHLGAESYRTAVQTTAIPQELRNSVVITLATVVLTLLVALPAGYVASRYDFRGKRAALSLLLATVMIPSIVTLVPQYTLAVRTHLYDTYQVLALIFAATELPTAVWLAKSFFDGIPREIEEAASIDGCSQWATMWHVIRPLSWNIVVTISIIVGIWSWGELIVGLNLTASDAHRPVMVGLYFFIGDAGIQWGPLTAAACISVLPIIVGYFLLRRFFVSGLTKGALK
ncbi:MAG: carbohydrate ABC transporter permease [Jatrophihabitans sp.]|uniref:carbohydrate ABC transporter permease n=1 Tax=Jatrophihabitans sp. TaxID=1932789 RepID=UPI003F7FA1F0